MIRSVYEAGDLVSRRSETDRPFPLGDGRWKRAGIYGPLYTPKQYICLPEIRFTNLRCRNKYDYKYSLIRIFYLNEMMKKTSALFLIFLLGGCGLKGLHSKGVLLKGRNVYKVFENKDVAQLAIAAANGNIEEMKSLIEKGVDVNDAGQDGITPLFWAFLGDNIEGFQLLLENGAKPNTVIGGNHAMRYYTEPIILENDDFEYTYDDAKFLEVVLQYGGDPNAVDAKDDTMLMIACGPGTMKRARLLVKAGAKLEQTTPLNGDTALLTASTLNQYDKVWYLINQGADYMAKDKFGYNLIDRIEEDVYVPGGNPVTDAGRKQVIAFLRKKGFTFTAYEEKK